MASKLEAALKAGGKRKKGKKKGKNWIAGAIKHPGALTAKAKKAGMSPMAFAAKQKGAKGTTGKQARLAMTLSKMHKGG